MPADQSPEVPDFNEPWQARAFALTVHLQAQGVFTWPQWSQALGDQLAAGDDPHRAWVRALEALLAAAEVVDPAAVEATTDRWHRAARATPHGTAIELENAPA